MIKFRLESIEKLKRKKDWYLCNFENSETLEVPGDLIYELRLRNGSELDQGSFESLTERSLFAKGKEKALRLLSFRERSEREIKQRIGKTGVKGEKADKVINYLKDLKVLDDENFAFRFTNDLLRRKSSGEFLVRSELIKKGISEVIINKVLYKVFDDNRQEKLAVKCAEKWILSHSRFTSEKQREKLPGHLKQRGFPWQIIEQTLGELSAL